MLLQFLIIAYFFLLLAQSVVVSNQQARARMIKNGYVQDVTNFYQLGFEPMRMSRENLSSGFSTRFWRTILSRCETMEASIEKNARCNIYMFN